MKTLTILSRTFVALAILPTGILASPPSPREDGVSKTFDVDKDDEAIQLYMKGMDANNAGLRARALVLATKAESLKRTRETSLLMMAIENGLSLENAELASEALKLYARQLELNGVEDIELISRAEQCLTRATSHLEDGKAWKKEVERIDPDWDVLIKLNKLKGIEAAEKSHDRIANWIVSIKKPSSKPASKPSRPKKRK